MTLSQSIVYLIGSGTIGYFVSKYSVEAFRFIRRRLAFRRYIKRIDALPPLPDCVCWRCNEQRAKGL